MIISGYEKPVEYGRLLIFDPTMAQMVLNAQKDYNDFLLGEYERGLKDLDNFYATYGDFISPFEKDMERYGLMIGGIRGALDEAYSKGINLLLSPEGRLLIKRLTNSIDPSEFNQMRANSKIGFEYLKSIEKAKLEGKFDENFENWALTHGGPGLFKDFSTKEKGMWNISSPYVYQDLNQFTGHIFDKMEDSFLGTGEDHYDYYGVSREDRAKALTQHLSGLLSQPLGQYHYLNSKAAYERMLGRQLSDKEAMLYWLNDILDSTTEYEHRNRKLNEMWKLQQEHASRMSAARATASGIQQALQPPTGLGVDTALATESALWHASLKKQYVEQQMKRNPDYNASRTRFGKMLKNDQEIGRKYMLALDVQNDPNATAEAKQEAAKYINGARVKKDANFVAWRKGYDKLVSSAENKWNSENTISGKLGYIGRGHIADIYAHGKEIYSKLHEIPQTSPLQAQLNQHLDYHVDGDGNKYSFMGKNKVLDITALTKLLGGKFDTSNSALISKVEKLLANKQYYENSNALNRTYGSGTFNGRTVNTARETVIFKSADLFKDFTKEEKEKLKYLGITSKGEGDSKEWHIPIATITEPGYSWAYQDAMTDKAIGGTSLSSQNWPENLARQFTNVYGLK